MPDCSAAQIIIGGEVKTPEAMADLMDALENEGVLGWCHGEPDEGWWDYLLKLSRNGEHLIIQSNCVPGGMFPMLEGVCYEHGLCFQRADDGHYAYAPSNAAFKPALGGFNADGTVESGPSISLKELVHWRKTGELSDKIDWLVSLFGEIPPLKIAQALIDAGKDGLKAKPATEI
jgi:hypothetical protein